MRDSKAWQEADAAEREAAATYETLDIETDGWEACARCRDRLWAARKRRTELEEDHAAFTTWAKAWPWTSFVSESGTEASAALCVVPRSK